ncbi:hypothetical protein DSO57_1032165 [Entomophthora muscae]|uniref:Uncharacterized protein n=1 Tax=Entomophthora muscae TaxID=34485 RepID=A0ACC2SPJ5_9FUNG|nr:hypothetical protein DSO57_1032165 [Entomophthora muscae]
MVCFSLIRSQFSPKQLPSLSQGLDWPPPRLPLRSTLKGATHMDKPITLVKIDYFLSQETRAKGWDSNPGPTFLQAARLMDQRPTRPCFFGIKPL